MGDKNKIIKIFFLISLITSFIFVFILNSSLSLILHKEDKDIVIAKLEKDEILDMVNCERLLSHAKNLSTLGSRVTGYDGSLLAAEYIANTFKKYGLNIKIHTFKVAVPIDIGARITVTSPVNKTFEAFTLWPNGVQTSPSRGLEGKLIYTSGLNLQDFDGKDLSNSIILMEFNTGENWLFLANMGAKAVIFIEPEDTINTEALSKRIDAPLYFPRLFVKKYIGEQLINLIENNKEVYVRIDSSMVWREVEAKNIIGIINGTEYPNDIIVLASHYDTWSIVPKVAYGANDALGVAFLLELTRYFAANKPKRTVLFVAFSGHWQALAGTRAFVEDFYFSTEVQKGTIRPWIFIGLGPFSWDTSRIQLLCVSNYFGAGQQLGTLNQRYAWILRKIFNEYLSDPNLEEVIRELVGQAPVNLVQERLSNLMWWGSMERPYILESEAVLMTGAIGFNIVSSPNFVYNKFFGVPIDDMKYIQVEKLRPQFIISSFILNSLINEKEWHILWRDVTPVRAATIGYAWGPAQNAGFITVIGRVASFNYSKGWYENVPNAIVCAYSLSNAFPFSKIYTISDNNGDFKIYGVPPFTLSYARTGLAIEAWVLNETDGTILFAPDSGIHGSKIFPNVIMPLTHPTYVTIIVANLRPITIFDVLDPKYIRPLVILDPRLKLLPVSDLYVNVGGSFQPLDFESRSEPLTYGVFYNPWESVAIIFVPPHSKNIITLRTGILSGNPSRWPIFLSNSSKEFQEGSGIKVEDKPVVIHFSAYNLAKDLYWVAKQRYENLRIYNIRSLSVERALNKVAEHLTIAENFYHNKTYSKAHSYALWSYVAAYSAYLEVMGLIQDSAITTIFMFIFIIIASLMIERLLVNAEKGIRRLMATIIIGFILILILSQVHPSFRLMSNATMGLLGSLLLILFAMVIGIIAFEVEKIMRSLSVRFLGKHFLEQARVGAFMSGLSSSIRLMRKHPLRTSLTLVTSFIVAMSMMAITSTSSYIDLRLSPTPYKVTNPLYETGVFIEKEYGVPPLGVLSKDLPTTIQHIYERKLIVMPRVVYYPQAVQYWGAIKMDIYSPSNNRAIAISALLGISPMESAILINRTSLLAAKAFSETDYNVCFLTTSQARSLNVSYGGIIDFKGYKMMVVGILEEDILNQIMDLNGLPIGVPDPHYIRVFAKDLTYPEQVALIPRLSWDKVLIVPLNFALDMGGYVISINIVPFSANNSIADLKKLVEILAESLDVNVWLKIEETTFSISRIHAYYMLGYESILVLITIATLNIVIAVLSSVRERMGEIRIFSLSGLSPTGSVSILLTESIVYALIGSVLGYFAGCAFNTFFINSGILPADFPFNYTSILVPLTISIVMMSTFLGTLYPAIMAAKLVLPSLKRKWELPTKPHGNTWTIPLPFRIPTLEEALGVLRFIKEYFAGRGSIGRMYMITKIGEISREEMKLEIEVKHAPFEMLIISKATIYIIQEKEGYFLGVYLERAGGSQSIWISSCYYFIDALRKQLLLWRSLAPSEQKRYMEEREDG
ncbi:MAG: M28 family peptidase [Candidatus Bathyarchaeia archaeon]